MSSVFEMRVVQRSSGCLAIILAGKTLAQLTRPRASLWWRHLASLGTHHDHRFDAFGSGTATGLVGELKNSHLLVGASFSATCCIPNSVTTRLVELGTK